MVETRITSRQASTRDPYADLLRAFSLLVVILWHWCFTILIWGDDGPSATSPLGFTSGLWILTWLLQVLPVFFYVGGYVHLKAWERASARGDTLWHFALRQAKALVIPSAALLITWVVLGIIVSSVFNVQWMGRAVLLVVSPLWFVVTYVALIVLLPVTVWLHRRYDVLVPVVLAGLAVVVDILRFRYQVPCVEWANMLFVWAFAFQLGYFYGRISGVDPAPRYSDGRKDWEYQSPRSRQLAKVLAVGGLFGLIGLVFSGLYPGSMVGVPGQGSNMAPPTVCIIALTLFQIGVAELIRPSVLRDAGRPAPACLGDHPVQRVRAAAVPVPHHRHGVVPGGRVVDLRRPVRGRGADADLVAAAAGGDHRAAALHAAGDLSVRAAVPVVACGVHDRCLGWTTPTSATAATGPAVPSQDLTRPRRGQPEAPSTGPAARRRRDRV